MLAEELVAISALEGLVWEVTTHHAKDFFRHFVLKFVLNLWHLNIKLRNWLWTHNSVDSFIADDHVQLLRGDLLFVEFAFLIHLLLLQGLLSGSPWGSIWSFSPLDILI